MRALLKKDIPRLIPADCAGQLLIALSETKESLLLSASLLVLSAKLLVLSAKLLVLLAKLFGLLAKLFVLSTDLLGLLAKLDSGAETLDLVFLLAQQELAS